ncbi:isochorismate synthase [Corynebacterium mastitidis]|uniref:isochorismate synthase n=1 Tax=Corynebacterium mastitidis TaxID=161890 RepID=UPI003CC7F1A7
MNQLFPEQEQLPDFFMRDPEGTTRANGGILVPDPKEAHHRAQAHNTGVVGMLPFDPSAPSSLRVPLRWERSKNPSQNQTHCQNTKAYPPLPRPVRALGWDSPKYRDGVAQVLAAIHSGVVEKVALARLLTLDYSVQASLNPAAILSNLLNQHPTAYVFAVRQEIPGHFVMGASPELVVSVQNGILHTHPLAGSAARVLGADPALDMESGESLMHSAKDRAEHAILVDDLAVRLRPLCHELEVPSTPSLLATPQLWHLGTRISGRLRKDINSLDVALAVHPTPAICGVPRDTAQDLISRAEPEPRGVFGGLVGWNDAAGNGRWALNLRSAAVSPRQARLFAGAGLVEGSTPEGEHQETSTKLSTFLAALDLRPEDVAELPTSR